MANYIIFGGHGKVALLTEKLLVDDGHSVTAVIRNPDHVADVEATGAKALVLDVEDANVDEIATAIGGHDAAIWSAGAGGGNPDRTYAVDRDAAIRSIDAARQVGVDRYIMVSYDGARKDHGVPPTNSFFHYAEAKAAADEYLRGSGLDWTILGPGALTLDEPTGTITVKTESKPDGVNRETSRANVARTVVAALDLDNTIGKTIGYADGEQEISEAFRGL